MPLLGGYADSIEIGRVISVGETEMVRSFGQATKIEFHSQAITVRTDGLFAHYWPEVSIHYADLVTARATGRRQLEIKSHTRPP